MSKVTAFNLALFSVLLSVLFGWWHVYICFGAALLLMLVFDGIWAAKVMRDKRFAALSSQYQPSKLSIPVTSTTHTRLHIPPSFTEKGISYALRISSLLGRYALRRAAGVP